MLEKFYQKLFVVIMHTNNKFFVKHLYKHLYTTTNLKALMSNTSRYERISLYIPIVNIYKSKK